MSQPLPNSISIADVADEVVTIETCVALRPRFADVIRRDRRVNPFLDWETSAATLRVYRLRDVVLDRSLMVLLKDGKVIAETNYLQPEAAMAAARVFANRLVRLDVGHTVATCFDHWNANYYHWIAHTVPTLQAILQRHPTGDVRLLLPKLRPWQRRSLDLMGVSDLPSAITEPGVQYLLPSVEYYDYVAGRADFSVSALSQAAYARMSAGAQIASLRHRRIYIDRSGPTNRRLPNEAALLARLSSRGFHAVRPEQLDLDQQISLFNGAAMVVGQLGAGLANIAFCKPGTVVYELVPEHHRNPCFLAMALQGGLEYWGDMFPTGVVGDDHTSAWAAELDIDHVLRRIDELETLVPAERR